MRLTKKEILQDFKLSIIKSKLIAHNTVEIETPDEIIIRYYETNIITKTIGKNPSIILNSGGYKTYSTKRRINDNQDVVGLYQENSMWFVENRNIEKFVFYDNMKFNINGKLLNPNKSTIGINYEKTINKNKRLLKKINNYCNKIDILQTIPKPSGGDCWLCLGNVPDNHIIKHINEGYLFGYLIYNALLHKGYDEVQISYIFQIDSNCNRVIIKNSLRNYLKLKLSIPK